MSDFDLDKPWNYLWYCYEKVPPPSLLPRWKVRGSALVTTRSPAYLCKSISNMRSVFFGTSDGFSFISDENAAKSKNSKKKNKLSSVNLMLIDSFTDFCYRPTSEMLHCKTSPNNHCLWRKSYRCHLRWVSKQHLCKASQCKPNRRSVTVHVPAQMESRWAALLQPSSKHLEQTDGGSAA